MPDRSLARPDRAWFYATVCTVTSVAGGVLGYFIGAVLYDGASAADIVPALMLRQAKPELHGIRST